MAENVYSTQVVREAPEIEARKLGLMDEAMRLYNENPLTLPAYEVAGLSAGQQQAADLARQGVGAYEPYLQAGSQGITQGQGLMQRASQGIAGIDVSGQFNAAEAGMRGAMGALGQEGAMAPDFTTSQDYLRRSGEMATGASGAYDPTMAQAYMNPYQQEVTQNTIKELNRQGAIQQQGLAAQAVRTGAFGGTREGVQRAELQRNLSDVMARQIAQDYANNYQQAQQAAMQGFESAQQRRMAASGQLGALGSQFGQQAATGTQLRQSGAGLMGQLSQGIGSLGAQRAGIDLQRGQLLGSMGQSIGALGAQQADIGRLASQLGSMDVANLANIGSMEQQNAQAQLDAQRMTQLQETMAPYQQLAYVSDIYKNAPSSQMALTSQTAPSANPWQQAIGTGIGAITTAAGAAKVFG